MTQPSIPAPHRLRRRPPWPAAPLALVALPLSLLALACSAPEDDGLAEEAQATSSPETCVTLRQGGGTTVDDARLANPPRGQNFGNQPTLQVGVKDESLVRFNLASIPADAVIQRATLKLYTHGDGDGGCDHDRGRRDDDDHHHGHHDHADIDIHRATATWNEATVTFQGFNQQFASAVSARMQVGGGSAQRSADVTGLVAAWQRGTYPNHGFLLETDDRRRTVFVSGEGATGQRPALQVCYTAPVDHCGSDPCDHGTCQSGSHGFTCSCDPGYSGSRCDVELDECATDPCVHGACIDGIGSYTCACEPGYGGAQCETELDECAASPCINGACTDGVDSYTCACQPGWTGADCELDLDECASGDPCNLGPGYLGVACTNTDGGYTCECSPFASGDHCEVTCPCIGDALTANDFQTVFPWAYSALNALPGTACTDDGAGTTVVDLQSGLPTDEHGHPTPGAWISLSPTSCAADFELANHPLVTTYAVTTPAQQALCRNILDVAIASGGLTCSAPLCDTFTCENAGTCVAYGAEVAYCDCAPGWTGAHCETNLDECEANPCQQGDCVDLTNAYECVCLPGWTGTNCDMPQ